jgi:hypothetical protein
VAEAGDIIEGDVVGWLEEEVDTWETQDVTLLEAVDTRGTQGVRGPIWQLKRTMGRQRMQKLMILPMETLLKRHLLLLMRMIQSGF